MRNTGAGVTEYHPGVTDCLFCRIAAGEIPADVVLETDTTLAFRDITPKANCSGSMPQ